MPKKLTTQALSTKILGKKGEDLTAAHLQGLGYRILGRNLRTSEGEIDLLAEDGEWLVFVEVRTRRGREFGTPQESITASKKERLIRVAEAYLEEHPQDSPWRIDIIAIELGGGQPRIEHFPNAISRES